MPDRPLIVEGPVLVLPADPETAGALVLAGRLLRARYRTDGLTLSPAVLSVLDAFDALWRAAGARSPGASTSAASLSASDSCQDRGSGCTLPGMLSSSAAASRLGVTIRRVRQMIDGGELDGNPSGRRLVSAASVETAAKARGR